MSHFTKWTPTAGDIVHFRDDKSPEITGRYRLDVKDDEPGYFAFTLLRTGKAHMLIKPCVLIEWQERGVITLFVPQDIERDRQALALRNLAPLRGRRAQADVDGLSLFDHERAPRMI